MDPFLYAPAQRISADLSALCVDWIFGAGLLLLATRAGMLAWSAWRHARAQRIEASHATALTPGIVLLCGVAEAIENDAQPTPFIELSIRQRGEEQHRKSGTYWMWSETDRTLTDRAFHLRTESGTIVRVEPAHRVDLVDRIETERSTRFERARVARIVAGERIWVRGRLTQHDVDTGPYRGEGGAKYVLAPPRDRPLFVSSEPIDTEERATARFNALVCAGLLAVTALLQLALFKPYRALHERGAITTARVVAMRGWRERQKHGYTPHWAFDLTWTVDGVSHQDQAEVSFEASYKVVDNETVPILYDPRDPSVMQVGPRDELGITRNEFWIALVLAGATLITWRWQSTERRPWWRRDKLNEETETE